MQIYHRYLHNCAGSAGVVVSVDVLRAFTTAAYALDAGAQEILLAGQVEEAFALRQRFPGTRLMGEVDGLPVNGFDYSNSPGSLDRYDIRGRTLIQRTTSGVQGIVRSQKAEVLLATSFVVAGATAQFIRELAPESVTFINTGYRPVDSGAPEGLGAEDAACAEYIQALLQGEHPSPDPYLQQARHSLSGRKFADPAAPEFPFEDLEAALEVDRFHFALRVDRRDGLLVMHAVTPASRKKSDS